jgi:tryptophan synthase alpha chain
MSNVSKAFSKGVAMIGFLTGGDPSLEKSAEFALAMAEGGCDLIEIGVPFSDPIAEGPVIQAANLRALAAGATVDGIFELVRKIREKTTVPLALLTYLNPVFVRGYERFCGDCERSGVDALIIPDLPMEERGELKGIAQAHGVDLIPLVAPTSCERIPAVVRDAGGFVYLVSSMGVTGVRDRILTDLKPMVDAVRGATATPVAVGFGVSTPEQARLIAGLADGVIVGSAIVSLIEKHGLSAAAYLRKYVQSMKRAANGG